MGRLDEPSPGKKNMKRAEKGRDEGDLALTEYLLIADTDLAHQASTSQLLPYAPHPLSVTHLAV